MANRTVTQSEGQMGIVVFGFYCFTVLLFAACLCFHKNLSTEQATLSHICLKFKQI
ncbi:MAG: hypothetical protein HFI63_05105 [Lachnospiraceae bacterium]|nr:hypothetical protein [Lachnospiraceae bacterium]